MPELLVKLDRSYGRRWIVATARVERPRGIWHIRDEKRRRQGAEAIGRAMETDHLNVSLASFWTPEYLPASAWVTHAPFAFWLVERLRPARYVELGVHHGYSFFSFCQAIQRLDLGTTAFAIDTWQGDEHAGLYNDEVFATVVAQNARYASFSTLMRNSFDEALPYFDDGSIDCLHIDGRHLYEDIQHDYGTWLPKLTNNAVVLFHDTNVRGREFGVWRFFKELAEQHPSFEFIHGHGLGIICPGSVVPEQLRELLNADVSRTDYIRSAYATLGAAIAERQLGQALRQGLAALRQPGADLSLENITARGIAALGINHPGLSIVSETGAALAAERAARIDAEQRAAEIESQLAAARESVRSVRHEAESDIASARRALRDAILAAEAKAAAQDEAAAAKAAATKAAAAKAEAAKTEAAKAAVAMAEAAEKAEASKAEIEARLAGALADVAAARTQTRDAVLLGDMLRRALDGRDTKLKRLQAEREATERAEARQVLIAEGLRRLLTAKNGNLTLAETRARRLARLNTVAQRVILAKDGDRTRAEADFTHRSALLASWGRGGREQLRSLRERLEQERSGRIAAESRLLSIESSKPWRAFSRLRSMLGRSVLPHQIGGNDTTPDGNAALISEIHETGLFDTVYYLDQNPDVVEMGIDPALHFALDGWREGRKPNMDFDPVFYLACHPDVAAAGVNPLVHYAVYGIEESLQPAPDLRLTEIYPSLVLEGLTEDQVAAIAAVHATGLFDAEYYRAAYPDVAASGRTPIAHYALDGWREGRNPNADFDTAFYLADNADAAALGRNPLLHYFDFGMGEGRATQPHDAAVPRFAGVDPGPRPEDAVLATGLFDADFYLAAYTDVAATGIDPAAHYARDGWREGRNPSPWFDTTAYMERHPDVMAAGLNPLLHYVEFGAAEGQNPLPSGTVRTAEPAQGMTEEEASLVLEIEETGLFDAAYYRIAYPDVVAHGVDPALHFVRGSWREGRKPNATFDPAFYLAEYPDVAAAAINPLVHFAERGLIEGRQGQRPSDGIVVRTLKTETQTASARSMIRTFGQNWSPLPVFADRRAPKTLTVLTDSVDAHSLFGGVGTALVLGALLAQRMNARLRLATRSNSPDPLALGDVLQAHGIEWTGPTDFSHVPLDGANPLALGQDDLILTTSWWTTRATLATVPANQIVYLLQEDERMFYPFGDMRLRCAETLAHPDVRTIVNTRLLFEHLCRGEGAIENLERRAVWFDPAFPAIPTRICRERPDGKSNFFFYARPNHGRNLYWRGLEVVDLAIRDGILQPDNWGFYFVGSSLPEMTVSGVQPINIAKLPWLEYAELMTRMDLGLCLMDTPHPSYPPLDLAAAGSVVVTNTHGPKQSLHHWSRNIISTSATINDLTEALRRGVALVKDDSRRMMQYHEQTIPRDWKAQILPAIDSLLSKAD